MSDGRDIDAAGALATWLVLGALVAYWWFMARALRALLRSVAELGRWLRDWHS